MGFIPIPFSHTFSHSMRRSGVTTYPAAGGRSSRKSDCPSGQEADASLTFSASDPRRRDAPDGGRVAPAAPGLPLIHTCGAGFGLLRVRCAHTRDRRRPAPRAALARSLGVQAEGGLHPGSGGGPSSALQVSSVFRSTEVILDPVFILISIAPQPCHAPAALLPRGTRAAPRQPHGSDRRLRLRWPAAVCFILSVLVPIVICYFIVHKLERSL